MAVVKFGIGISEMKGEVGGVIFSSWRGIKTVRHAKVPTLRRETGQPQNRAWLGYLSRYFGTLSEANRDLWQIWADEHLGIDKFGDPFIMTAGNAFVSLNIIAAQVGGIGGVSDTPPLANLVETITDFVVDGGTNPGEIDLDWTLPGAGDAGDFVQTKKGGPYASPALKKTVPEMDFDGTVAGNLLTKVNTGLVEEGWYWYAARYVGADGQVANWKVGQSQPTPTP